MAGSDRSLTSDTTVAFSLIMTILERLDPADRATVVARVNRWVDASEPESG
jgi:hypothetical protein